MPLAPLSLRWRSSLAHIIGRQRQGNDGRNEDRHAERDGKLAEQPPHHIAHEQQRNQYGDQRDGQAREW